VGANAIEIEFTTSVQADSVIDQQTFIVTNPRNVKVPGTITLIPERNAVLWTGQVFPTDQVYTVTLVGDPIVDPPKAITSVGGSHLDGEPKADLPSGNNEAGGDFKFSLRATPEILI
jgi:hypothetical protein